MLKRIVAIVLIALLVLSVGMIFVRAEGQSVEVYVTIADEKGELALAAEKITVTDIDDDGILTINDALFIAHEEFYEGDEAGFGTEMTKYGLSMTKLWGHEDGYNYGYTLNNELAWNMTDVVGDGDYVAAYCFTDTKNFADKYSYFDKLDEEIEGDRIELTLTKLDFDKDGFTIKPAVAGAQITVDGEATDVVTDENGKATVIFKKNGKHLVSATASDQVIVPPVCLVTVTDIEEAPTEEPTANGTVTEETDAPTVVDTVQETQAVQTTGDKATSDSATKDSATKDSASGSSPQTGDVTRLWLWILIAGVCLIGVIGALVFYVKRYGKK